MFCYKCGERLWDGRISCQKCGADVPRDVQEAENPALRWPLSAALAGVLAALVAGFFGGRLAFRPFHPRTRPSMPIESDEITPLNVRDPSALVMRPYEDLDSPAPAKKAR